MDGANITAFAAFKPVCADSRLPDTSRHEGLGYGVRARLARTLGVSKATITSDVRAILTMPVEDLCRQRHQGVRRASATRRGGQPPRAEEDTMGQRCTVRLPDMLYEFLQIEADARQCGVSDLIREGLERLLGLTSDHSAEPPKAPEPASHSTPPPHDCTERILARLPMDVREDILARARLLEMPAFQVLRALLVVQLSPSQPSPQASGTARPQRSRCWLKQMRSTIFASSCDHSIARYSPYYWPSTSMNVSFAVCAPSTPARYQSPMAPGPVAGPVSAP
jgi:hypothetical protein